MMLKSIWKILVGQSVKVKILLIFISILSIGLMGYAAKYAWVKRKLVIKYKEEIKGYEVQLVESNKREQASIDKAKQLNNYIKSKQFGIDKKLKQDEKIIDNDTITDDDIRSFISKHQKR